MTLFRSRQEIEQEGQRLLRRYRSYGWSEGTAEQAAAEFVAYQTAQFAKSNQHGKRLMGKAALIRKYGRGKAWERAGLYYLDPPMPQRRRDGGYDHHRYVMVMVQGDTADMYEADANGKLTGHYARWTPLTRDDGSARGLVNVALPSCTGALEAEGYTVVPMGEMTA